MTFRTLLFNLHLYVGLSVGLVLVVVSLTGSALVFKEEIDAALHPELLRVQPGDERIALQEVVEAVRRAYPERPPSEIQMPRSPEGTYEVTTAGSDPLQVYVDPYRGTILGERRPTETLTNMLFDLHVALLAGMTGEWIVGIAALLLLVLALTGSVLWWPGIQRLRDGLTIRRGANWKRVNFDVHRAGGMWSLVFLVVIAVTGASLIFHDQFAAGLNWLTRSPPPPHPPAVEMVPGVPPLPLDALVARANRALPGGEVSYLLFPSAPDAALTVRKHFDPELHPNGRSFIYLHSQTGDVLAVEHALRAPAGTRAYNVLYPIHIGRWGGITSKILYVVLGLAPVVLFVSGSLIWWNRMRAKGVKTVRRRQSPVAPAPKR